MASLRDILNQKKSSTPSEELSPLQEPVPNDDIVDFVLVHSSELEDTDLEVFLLLLAKHRVSQTGYSYFTGRDLLYKWLSPIRIDAPTTQTVPAYIGKFEMQEVASLLHCGVATVWDAVYSLIKKGYL